MKKKYLKNFNFSAPEIPSATWKKLDGYLRRFRLTAYLSLLALMLLACGQEASGTGGYRANLVFPEDIQRLAETSSIDCTAAHIDAIEFNFIADGQQYGPYRYDCEEHNALIPQVPAGTGITVEVFADDVHGKAILEGFEVIDIPKDEVVTGGTIRMQHVPPEPTTDTDTDVANFNGTWAITDYGEGCPPIGISNYISEIVQLGESAAITTTVTISPSPVPVQCTVNGAELSCPHFEFEDNSGRIHRYTEFILRYVDRNNLDGKNSWTLYWSGGGFICNGMSEVEGGRLENTDEIEQ